MLSPDSGRKLTGSPKAGCSPMPNVLQERSPTTGSICVGWGHDSDLSGGKLPSAINGLPRVQFKRCSNAAASMSVQGLAGARRKGLPSNGASIHESIQPLPTVDTTPKAFDVVSDPRSPKSVMPLAKVDEQMVKIIGEQRQVDGAIIALATFQGLSPKSLSPDNSFSSKTRSSPRSSVNAEADSPPQACACILLPTPTDHSPIHSPKVTSEERGACAVEWDAQRRHDHASRLLHASRNASRRAAAKMLAMAANESLRRDRVEPPEEQEWPLPEAARRAIRSATLGREDTSSDDAGDDCPESATPPKPAPPQRSMDYCEIVARSPDVPGAALHASMRAHHAREASPMECFGLSLKAVLAVFGCNVPPAPPQLHAAAGFP